MSAFLHDVRNAAGSIVGVTHILAMDMNSGRTDTASVSVELIRDTALELLHKIEDLQARPLHDP